LRVRVEEHPVKGRGGRVLPDELLMGNALMQKVFPWFHEGRGVWKKTEYPKPVKDSHSWRRHVTRMEGKKENRTRGKKK